MALNERGCGIALCKHDAEGVDGFVVVRMDVGPVAGRHNALILLSSTGSILGMSPVGGPWSGARSMRRSASCGNQERL